MRLVFLRTLAAGRLCHFVQLVLLWCSRGRLAGEHLLQLSATCPKNLNRKEREQAHTFTTCPLMILDEEEGQVEDRLRHSKILSL